MRVAVLALAVTAGCLRGGAFVCDTDSECTRGGEAGRCELVGHCSFADPECASGRRFADLSGSYSNSCVGGDDGGDAGVDDAAPPGDGAPPDASPVGCPANYVELAGISNRRYRRLAAASWTNHRSTCAAEASNVHLAIPDNEAELLAISALAGENYWIGISDLVEEGTFVTVLGALATYLPWAPGEPDNAGNQDCVRARVTAPLIETANCGTQAVAICECVP
jgi:hypothetical protein